MDSEITGDYVNTYISGQGTEIVYNPDYITDAIVILIPQVSKLCGIYQAWYPLKEEEREALDNKAVNNFSNDYLALYQILIEALQRWDEIQDIQGASGVEQGLVVLDCHLEKQLLAIVNRLESFLEPLTRMGRPPERFCPPQWASRSPCRSRYYKAYGKRQLHCVQSLADQLSGSDLPEPLSD